tara:strand:- start:162 stop:1190 length:1029 start_codon:yes stop_codon:yes gene_type:complete
MNTAHNILKEKEKIINLSQSVNLNELVDTNKILKHNFEKNNLKINGFEIKKEGKYYFINKGKLFNENKLFSIYNLIKKYNNVFYKYKDLFIKLIEEKRIITSSLNLLFNYIYFELIIYLGIASYKHNLNINNNIEKEKINKIVGKKLKYSQKRTKKTGKEYVRTGLVQRTRNSKYWTRYEYSKNIDNSIVSILKNINIYELELPASYEKNKVKKLLEDLEYVLNFLKIENRSFEVRFKKLGLYKKEGMYLKNAKCIIVDPRYAKTLFHELGHFLYETNTSFLYKNKKLNKKDIDNIVKENSSKYENKLVNHKIEELDEKSEIFAYWFEDFILKNIISNKKIN